MRLSLGFGLGPVRVTQQIGLPRSNRSRPGYQGGEALRELASEMPKGHPLIGWALLVAIPATITGVLFGRDAAAGVLLGIVALIVGVIGLLLIVALAVLLIRGVPDSGQPPIGGAK